MNNPVCKKVMSLLSLYIENKLDDDDKFLVETHLFKCSGCYQKYIEMKEVINNLHFEYEKLVDDFNRLETDKHFNIREYENFYNNISPYIDDELCYEDSIKFRKYLLNSKAARSELSAAYGLRNNIKLSVEKLKNNLNINFSKKIIQKLRNENSDNYERIYKRAAIAISIMITALIVLSLISYKHLNKQFSMHKRHEITNNGQIINQTEFPSDEDYVEFIFDENNEALLANK